MKIGYIVKRYPRFSETFIVNEILAHERAGLEIEIFALLPPEDTHFQNKLADVRAPVTYLPTKVWKASDFWHRLQAALQPSETGFGGLADAVGLETRDVAQAFELSALVRERGITQLHAHFASAATSVARLAAKLTGVPYTFTAHAKDIFHSDVDRGQLRRKFQDAAASITVSDYNVNVLRAEFGAAAGKLQRVYNGMDLGEFQYSAPDLSSRVILAVGRLVEKKGFDDLIDACALLRSRGIEFVCQIVGTGECEEALSEKIRVMSLGEHVKMLGARPQKEVKQLIRNAAVFAAPCRIGSDGNRDGLPTVLVEAMALGTPCVSTPVTGIPEAIADDRTGRLVASDAVVQLADALADLLDDDAARIRYSENARRHIEKNFDIETNAARIRKVFEKVAPAERVSLLEVAS